MRRPRFSAKEKYDFVRAIGIRDQKGIPCTLTPVLAHCSLKVIFCFIYLIN